jgi:hypothetical protein
MHQAQTPEISGSIRQGKFAQRAKSVKLGICPTRPNCKVSLFAHPLEKVKLAGGSNGTKNYHKPMSQTDVAMLVSFKSVILRMTPTLAHSVKTYTSRT